MPGMPSHPRTIPSAVAPFAYDVCTQVLFQIRVPAGRGRRAVMGIGRFVLTDDLGRRFFGQSLKSALRRAERRTRRDQSQRLAG